MASTVAKHVFLVTISWRQGGSQGYAMERYRTGSIDYLDLVQSISDVSRSTSPTGSTQFPTITITFYNRDLYFTKKLAEQEHRNIAIQVAIVPPNSTSQTIIFSGLITKGNVANGIFTVQATGNSFDELYGSAVASLLPALTHANFPNLPVGQVASEMLPLLFGQFASPFVDDLADPVAAGAVKARLIDITGNSRDFVGHTSGPAATNTMTDVIWVSELSKFVALGLQSATDFYAWTSTDGITYTSNFVAANNKYNALAWSKDLALMVAVGDGVNGGFSGSPMVRWSVNGTSWVDVAGFTNSELKSVCWANTLGLFVAVGLGPTYVATSPDGLTWTVQTPAANKSWMAVAWSQELQMLAAVSISNDIMTSPDGITWTTRTAPTGSATGAWTSICWSPQRAVFMASAGSLSSTPAEDTFMASEDGLTWFLGAAPLGQDDGLGGNVPKACAKVIWAPELSLFLGTSVYGGDTQGILISGDGVDWIMCGTPVGTLTPVFGPIAWSPELNIVSCPLATPRSDLQTITSPSGLGDQYRYGLAASTIAGDPALPGYLTHVFAYGVATPYRKPITSYAYGDFLIPTICFATDQRSNIDASQDRPEITFYAAGTTVDATPSGTIIRDGVTVKQFLIQNYTVGNSPYDPTSFTAAIAAAKVQHYSDTETGGIAPASMGILIDQPSTTLQSIIETVDKSFAMMTYPTRDGKIGALISPIGALPAPSLTLTDESAILKDSLSINFPDEITVSFHPVYSYRYTSGQAGDPNPGPQFSSKIPNWDIPATLTRLFTVSITRATDTANFGPGITREMELPYNRRAISVLNTLRAYGEYAHPGAQFLTLEVPISYYNQIEIGDYVGITHWQGINVAGNGYVNDTIRIIGIDASLEPTSPKLKLTAHRRFPGTWLHDNFDRTVSNSLGTDWNELGEISATTFQIKAGTGGADTSAITSFQQTNSLYCPTGESGFVLASQLAYADQVASIAIINRDNALMRTGVIVRGTGSYGVLSGYAAIYEYDPTGPTATVYLRRYNTEDITGAGTLLGSFTLNIPEVGTSTWLNQGDILELRATHMQSFGERIEVFYWSDINSNNLGRIISVREASGILATGQSTAFGMICQYGANHRTTNFYGRSYYPSFS